MKQIIALLFSLIVSQLTLASTPDVAATIKIINQLKNPVERTGASFGCGANSGNLSTINDQEQINCEYQGRVYYSVTLPDINIGSENSTESSVIAYPTENPGYGRLGFQYALADKPRLGCSLIMDFTGDKVTSVQIQPLFPNPGISCVMEGSDNNLQLVIKAKI